MSSAGPATVAAVEAHDALMGSLMRDGAPTRAVARAWMSTLIAGELSQVRVAAALTALAMRPPTAEALIGCAEVLRAHARRLPIAPALAATCLDTCGTGGSGLRTVNTSTMVAFLLAAAGVPVTKHGNRKSSGHCGSVDVLEALGVRADLTPEQGAALLAGHGVSVMFAPMHHPAVGAVMPVRRELGFRTIFNLLGPLGNPAGAGMQLLGVADALAAPAMAEALAGLGVQRALVVRGDDGLDELTLTGPTTAIMVEAGRVVETTRWDPREVGLSTCSAEAMRGGDATANALTFEAVLSGVRRGPHADLVALNAGAALWLARRAGDLAEGVVQAQALLANGEGWRRFCAYRDASRQVAS